MTLKTGVRMLNCFFKVIKNVKRTVVVNCNNISKCYCFTVFLIK